MGPHPVWMYYGYTQKIHTMDVKPRPCRFRQTSRSHEEKLWVIANFSYMRGWKCGVLCSPHLGNRIVKLDCRLILVNGHQSIEVIKDSYTLYIMGRMTISHTSCFDPSTNIANIAHIKTIKTITNYDKL